MKRCSLELGSQTSHDINNDRTCLDLSSDISYILLLVLLLELLPDETRFLQDSVSTTRAACTTPKLMMFFGKNVLSKRLGSHRLVDGIELQELVTAAHDSGSGVDCCFVRIFAENLFKIPKKIVQISNL